MLGLASAIYPAHVALALEPDQILLITNKNNPDSARLAALYSQLRNIPADHIVALDLPDAEEMPFAAYETGVVAPVRQFILDHQLRGKITCLLTFYGVPFRVSARTNSPADQAEVMTLHKHLDDLATQMRPQVDVLEKQATGLDSAFKPATGDSIDLLDHRIRAAIATIIQHLSTMPDSPDRRQETTDLMSAISKVAGPAGLDAQIGASQRADPNKSPEDRQKWIDLHDQAQSGASQIRQLQSLRWDADARARLVILAGNVFGPLGQAHAIEAELRYFDTVDTTAATDSELALLWWDYYPRSSYQANALNYRFKGRSTPIMMTMRLDGPDAATVERMIKTSVEVEKTGLLGIIAIDARGIEPADAAGKPNEYGVFDEKLRKLAVIIRTKTDLKIKFDNQDIVFPPHSVKDVALYCGWYSVGHYIPGCDFNPGAVGFHIASFEMVHLHGSTGGWVHGLLSDGVVATLGPVAEPYLGAFPAPDEFFPLLLTGKLSMAEVYWKTTPLVSWMISFIGDPLYTPFKDHPAIHAADLPIGLQQALNPDPR